MVRQHVVLRRLRRAARRGPDVPSRRREEGGRGVERLRHAAFRIGAGRARPDDQRRHDHVRHRRRDAGRLSFSRAGGRVGAGAEPAGQHEPLGAQLPDSRAAPRRRQPAGARRRDGDAQRPARDDLQRHQRREDAGRDAVAGADGRLDALDALPAAWRRRDPLPHRVRERRQPAARARQCSHARDCAPLSAGRRPLAHPAAARRREPAACRDWRRAGTLVRLRGHRRIDPAGASLSPSPW